ncbi:glycerol-3-phosphate responsive antiterminator [Brevibacillus fulvus]|uniref:Glycerol uptake operon antiterminator regulatory protein n=1 Tax=Brevibacillus fulvus TaxID=1125967 RepID=A0A938XUC9_9BACL|nr:glycerol-3-phosphate responsive antiterminator [Brevibacillus fulvus]MBM7590272.1 glycerol uptake operon antiterminator [Brevibacillus fulvus]
MDQAAFYERLQHYRMIASVKKPNTLERALAANVSAAVLSIGNIGVIKHYVNLFKNCQMPVFVHLERIGGISFDREGIAFLAQYVKPTGIVTTRNTLIKLAKKEGMLTIQRLFLIDSDSIVSGLQSVQETQPDAVEIMPALLPEYIGRFSSELNQPIIAGGLIRERAQMLAALDKGAVAVSVGTHQLWKECLTDESTQISAI